MQIGTFEAKNKLSALLDRAERGEIIHITRRGKAIAELRAMPKAGAGKRFFGGEKDLVKSIAVDFTAPLEDFRDYESK